MKRFSLTDLNRASGAVIEAAFKGPVELTDRGKRKFVILTAEDYDRMLEQPRRAFHLDDMSYEELTALEEALADPPT